MVKKTKKSINGKTILAFFICLFSGFWGVPLLGHSLSLLLIPSENRKNNLWLFLLSGGSILAFLFSVLMLMLSFFIIPAFIIPISTTTGFILQFSSLPISLIIGLFMLFGNN